MKCIKYNKKGVIYMNKLYLFLFAMLVSLIAINFSAYTQNVLSEEDDIISLIESANTPEDHLKIADYYDTQAAKMETEAKRHDSMAKAYEKRSKPLKAMVNHCVNISKELRESAEQHNAMSLEHRTMAQEMNN
jgi:hypothetical protein